MAYIKCLFFFCSIMMSQNVNLSSNLIFYVISFVIFFFLFFIFNYHDLVCRVRNGKTLSALHLLMTPVRSQRSG